VDVVRILIADDHELFRRGLRSLLTSHPGWEVCAEAADGREAVEKTRRFKPDVAILDVNMPNLNGLEATRQIHEEFPQTQVLVVSQHAPQQVLSLALRAGARGFISKEDLARELLGAIDAVTR
jgi:DNA-binding NarL/FixJ family response regulator